ncbi:MAG: hypothetical protein HOO91_01625 [Bacteroidales bacterium]|nr:hypothetical protein [Bacteroidales bacterium]
MLSKLHKETFIDNALFYLLCGTIAFAFVNINLALPILVLISLFSYLLRQRGKISDKNIYVKNVLLFIIVIYEFFNYSQAINEFNSLNFLIRIIFLIFIYYSLKSYLALPHFKTKLFLIISIIGLIFGIVSILEFIYFHYNIGLTGFSDIVDFKYIFRPLNILINEWVSICLILLPFTTVNYFLLENKKKYRFVFAISMILTVVCILISFSRGAYIALALFIFISSVLLFIYKVFNLKKLISLNIAVILICSYLIIPYHKSVLSTISLFKTTSQQRSIEGRKELYSSGIAIFKDNYKYGIGSNNFAIANNTYKEKNIDTVFTGRTNNSWLQILIEKGLIGFFLYSTVFCFAIFTSLNQLRRYDTDNFRKIQIIILNAGFIAFIMREFTFSSLLTNNIVLILTFLLLMFILNENHFKIRSNISIFKHVFFVVLMIIGIYGSIMSYKIYRAQTCNLKCIDEFNKGNNELAEYYNNKSIEYFPNNSEYMAHKGFLNYLKYKKEHNDSLLFRNTNGTDVNLITSRACYNKSFEINNKDDFYLFNLGILSFLTGDKELGLEEIDKAILVEPNIAIYHIVKGLILEKNGDSINSIFNEYTTALILSPELTDSYFYKDFRSRFPVESKQLIQKAIERINKLQLSNPIIMAKLGKLHLANNDTVNANKFLLRVTQIMPNVNRPWLYLGDIGKAKQDTTNMKIYYERSAYLDYGDFLPANSLANYYYSIKRNEIAIEFFKKTLTNWLNIQSQHSNTSENIYLTKSISNNLLPVGILYYIRPIVDFEDIQVKLFELNLSDEQKKEFNLLFSKISEKINNVNSISISYKCD